VTNSGRIFRAVFTGFGRLKDAWRNEAMHRMSGNVGILRFGGLQVPLLGDFCRSP
jgi:hypothetical protein